MSQEISLSVGGSSLRTQSPALALQVLQHLCPDVVRQLPAHYFGSLEVAKAESGMAIGSRFEGCVIFARHWVGGVEYALIDLGAAAEIKGAWGKRDQEVATNHGDGLANTQAMAGAGSDLAKRALEAGAYIPSAAECHLLMHAKQIGLVTGLREDIAYWTSSQFSANFAYFMFFELGWHFTIVKLLERPVRLVRRIPIIR